jgi:hypothetical protein
MVFNLTHSQIILRYKENGGRIEPYTIVIMGMHMVCPPATSEAEARWPRFGLVVVATTSRRDNKDQMIRP